MKWKVSELQRKISELKYEIKNKKRGGRYNFLLANQLLNFFPANVDPDRDLTDAELYELSHILNKHGPASCLLGGIERVYFDLRGRFGSDFLKILEKMKLMKLLNIEIFSYILAQARNSSRYVGHEVYAKRILKIYQILNNPKLQLVKHIADLIEESDYPDAYVEYISLLVKYGLYSKENLAALYKCQKFNIDKDKWVELTDEFFYTCKCNKLLDQRFFIEFTSDADNFVEKIKLFNFLVGKRLLPIAILQQLKSHENPKSIMFVIKKLEDIDTRARSANRLENQPILNVQNIQAIFSCRDVDKLDTFMYWIEYKDHFLGNHYFVLLCRYIQVIGQYEMTQAFNRIPRHRFTAEVVDQIFTICMNDEQDAVNEIVAYLNNIMIEEENRRPRPQNPSVPAINYAQSIHNKAVEKTITESAIRLHETYQEKISGEQLNNIIQSIPRELELSADDDPNSKKAAAWRAFARITSGDFSGYRHSGSNLSITELMALIWVAIHDDEKRLSLLEEAKKNFIEALYEIQRGYNLDADGFDNDGNDLSICTGGTFNKLVEKQHGMHSLIDVQFITVELATLKLPRLVQEVMVDYFKNNIINIKTAQGLIFLLEQVQRLTQEAGIEPIWKRIKPEVSVRMYDEYGSLFQGKSDHNFILFVENGCYAPIDNIPSFKKEVSESKGYQKYCSTQLRYSRIFTLQLETAVAEESDTSDSVYKKSSV